MAPPPVGRPSFAAPARTAEALVFGKTGLHALGLSLNSYEVTSRLPLLHYTVIAGLVFLISQNQEKSRPGDGP